MRTDAAATTLWSTILNPANCQFGMPLNRAWSWLTALTAAARFEKNINNEMLAMNSMEDPALTTASPTGQWWIRTTLEYSLRVADHRPPDLLDQQLLKLAPFLPLCDLADRGR
jgi:hypothetical protein